MNIHLLAVGRMKGNAKYLQTGIDEYLKRLAPYAKIRLTELADEPPSPTRTEAACREIEGERLLAQIPEGAYVITLSEHGETYSSEVFSREWFKRTGGNPSSGGAPSGGSTPIIVIIGGATGLAPGVLRRSQWVVSLSPLTFPHQLVRLVFLEQLYRAFKIFRNEPYHK